MNQRPKYRIVKQLIDEGDDNHPPLYSCTIREVFYLEDGTIHSYSEETIPFGYTTMELQEDLLKMLNALVRPALNEDCEEIKN